MKKVRLTTVFIMAFLSLSIISCKEAKTEKKNSTDHHTKMNHDNSDGYKTDKKEINLDGNGVLQAVLKDYFNLKDALVADDNSKAKKLGSKLAKSLGNINILSNYSEGQKADLKDIIEDAIEHGEHISKSDIAHQREHFKTLSKDMSDLIAITGTSMKIYEQFCPMYDNNKGGAWLSMNEEIRNPYFGDKMLKCGKVQREIN